MLVCGNCFSQGQMMPRTFVNNTGRDIGLVDIRYPADTLALYGYLFLQAGGSSTGSGNIYNSSFRLDLIAIDNLTKDTLFTKSYTPAEIAVGTFIIENGVKEKLIPLEPTSRLMMKATSFKKIFKLGDTLNLKLATKEKIEGKLIAFNNEYITLVLSDNTERKVYTKDVVAVKTYYGSLKEKYFDTPYIKFIEVVHKWNKKEHIHEWIELKGIKLKEK